MPKDNQEKANSEVKLVGRLAGFTTIVCGAIALTPPLDATNMFAAYIGANTGLLFAATLGYKYQKQK